MALRTKPVRIFEDDHAPLRLLASLKQQSTAETVHELLADYLAAHKDELSGVFARTQEAIAAGDLKALTEMLSASADSQVDAMMEHLPGRE